MGSVFFNGRAGTINNFFCMWPNIVKYCTQILVCSDEPNADRKQTNSNSVQYETHWFIYSSRTTTCSMLSHSQNSAFNYVDWILSTVQHPIIVAINVTLLPAAVGRRVTLLTTTVGRRVTLSQLLHPIIKMGFPWNNSQGFSSHI